MAYIGKDPAQIKRALNEKDTFTGDGSTVAFDLTSDASGANEIQVFVDNIRQEPGASDAYTLGEDGSGNLRRITFTAAPDSGAEIYVINPKTTDSNLIVPSDNSVTSAKIVDGAIVNTDINACAAISDTKLGTISTACKVATSAISQPGSSSVYLADDGSWGAIDTSQQDTNAFNISLLGFKMAVNEGLTVFNLVDGVVDEFNDESGTDEAEGSNDLYCGTSDYYINSTTPDGGPLTNSAGFTMTTTTEPDTSTAGTNPGYTTATPATYTVPCGTCSVGVYIWGAGGSGAGSGYPTSNGGGGGGFSSGNLSVTAGQTLKIIAGEGGARNSGSVGRAYFRGGVGFPSPNSGNGGGLSVVHTGCIPSYPVPAAFVPSLYMIAGSGGGGNASFGGSGGGLQGDVGRDQNEQTNAIGYAPPGVDFENGGGGSQSQGGQGGYAEASATANNGELLIGGDGAAPAPDNQGS